MNEHSLNSYHMPKFMSSYFLYLLQVVTCSKLLILL